MHAEQKPLYLSSPDLPEAVIGCWFVREGELLTPGPLVSLLDGRREWTLFLEGGDSFPLGTVLSHILVHDGERVGRGAVLAAVENEGGIEEHDGAGPVPLLEGGAIGLHLRSASRLRTSLLRRSARLRRCYRRLYPLFRLRLGSLLTSLLLIAGTWLLIHVSLSVASAGGLLPARGGPLFQSISSAILAVSTWVFVVGAGLGVLLLALGVASLILLERERWRWRRRAAHK